MTKTTEIINGTTLKKTTYTNGVEIIESWEHPNGKISKRESENNFTILHFVEGMDGNVHRVFWHTETLVQAIEYLNKN